MASPIRSKQLGQLAGLVDQHDSFVNHDVADHDVFKNAAVIPFRTIRLSYF
jgi:hypothetical protein